MTDHLVERLRAHHRLVSDKAKILPRRYLDSTFSMVEVRVMHELDHQAGMQAGDLAARIGIDKAVMSRVLGRLERDGIVERHRVPRGRGKTVDLTPAGRKAVASVRAQTNAMVADDLSHLDDRARADLAAALDTVDALLQPRGAIWVRPYRRSDLDAVVEAQDRIYRHEFGWNGDYADFARRMLEAWQPEPGREFGWVAQRDGKVVGSIFLFDADGVAQIRQLYVGPEARGHGLGRELVGRFIAAARRAGYARARLWTQQSLGAARRLYADFDFHIVSTREHRMFGADLTEEIWERDL